MEWVRKAVDVSATGAVMDDVVRVVRVMGVEVVWLRVLRKAEQLESWAGKVL